MTRRKLAVAAVVVVPVVAYAIWAGYARCCRTAVQGDTYVGWTEAEVCGTYGTPDKDWPGCQPLALRMPPPHPGTIRTLVFHPRGLFHPEGGTLWVWVVERDGQWVCYRSCWFADGVQF